MVEERGQHREGSGGETGQLGDAIVTEDRKGSPSGHRSTEGIKTGKCGEDKSGKGRGKTQMKNKAAGSKGEDIRGPAGLTIVQEKGRSLPPRTGLWRRPSPAEVHGITVVECAMKSKEKKALESGSVLFLAQHRGKKKIHRAPKKNRCIMRSTNNQHEEPGQEWKGVNQAKRPGEKIPKPGLAQK